MLSPCIVVGLFLKCDDFTSNSVNCRCHHIHRIGVGFRCGIAPYLSAISFKIQPFLNIVPLPPPHDKKNVLEMEGRYFKVFCDTQRVKLFMCEYSVPLSTGWHTRHRGNREPATVNSRRSMGHRAYNSRRRIGGSASKGHRRYYVDSDTKVVAFVCFI